MSHVNPAASGVSTLHFSGIPTTAVLYKLGTELTEENELLEGAVLY